MTTSTKTRPELTQQQALALTQKMRRLLVTTQENFDKIIEEMVETRVCFGPELSAYAAWKMMAEGADDAEIAGAVKGVGPAGAGSWRRQRDNGVPPQDASIRRQNDMHVVAEHLRKNPTPSRFLHLEIDLGSVARVTRYERAARREGRTLREIATGVAEEAIRARFEERLQHSNRTSRGGRGVDYEVIETCCGTAT